MSVSGRKVRFEEKLPPVAGGGGAAGGAGGDSSTTAEKSWNRTFSSNHTLDSDEEDDKKEEVDKYELKEEDVEGAEDATVIAEGGIRVTPFNLAEEMQEGRFDEHGNYYEKKDKEVRDNWLDNIDWMRYSEKGTEERIRDDEINTESPEPEPSRLETKIFADIIGFLNPGETITKAVRRLGGGKKKGVAVTRKWGPKKAKLEEEEGSEVDKESMLKLTGFVDELVASGNYEAYQYTFEKITHLLKEAGSSKKDEDMFDMFGDGPSKEDVSKKDGVTSSAADDAASKDSNGAKSNPTAATVFDPEKTYWEYKWENKDEADKFGPYESQQMQDWKDQDFFADGVWVRKVGSEGNFYQSKRIDFELYL
ncbi:CD2 antigen cytoplasmic tail-binding protein 2 homolog [Asterias amurensis]|uniref:CD2 antigen cytoplasmic tail-binding protein 2 homolog n=1 Tax=Asterias amurensis TaxID=7602 RepID=UPI003AB67A83